MKTIISLPFLFLILVEHTVCDKPVLTTKEIPLYIRQSWIKVTDPIRTKCICKSGVNPTVAFKSMMNTEISNNPCLKCFYKCIAVKLNLMDATTGALSKKEFLRQLEGVTAEIFEKCNEQTKDEVDFCQKAFDVYLCLVHLLMRPKSYSTPPPLPLKSWEDD